jgi:PAS domain S-box-containing protein
MNDVIKQSLEQILQVCAVGPIHQIGNIQPHGATLVLSADSLRTVLQASANISRFIDFPAEGALGKPLAELIGRASALHIEQLIQDANRQNTATGLVSVSRQQIAVDLDVHVYSASHFWVLELCNDDGLPKRENLGELLMHMQNSLLFVESDTTQYFAQVTKLVQTLTGYDSVMTYRFEANWNGEVIAQSRVETAPSYLDTQFHPGDIPPKTRELYTKNLVHIVTDVSAEPIPIIPTLNPVSQQPLDMTCSALCSLAPIHMEYLHNMGVEASMMISLLQNGRLWGLIYCHHMTPKRVSFAMRDAALFISRMASTELTAIEKRDNRKPVKKTSLKAGALQSAIFNSANFSSIATDANGVIQIFNVGAENMLGYAAEEVMNKITPADISDPQEVIARANALTDEFETPIAPGFEALVFKASRGIEDIYELTYIRKDGSRFSAVVSVTALRDAQDVIIGYLLIGTDNTARKQAEEALVKAGALQSAIFNSANFSSIATDANGVIQIFNVGAENMLGYTAEEVMNKITPADISDPQEVIARANALTDELETPIAPGFEALVFKASRGIEDIYELTYIRKDGSRFPAVVSVTALRDAQDAIIGYLLIGTDNTARKLAEEALLKAGALQSAIFNSANFSSIATDANGVIQIFNVGAENMLGYTAEEVMNKITPADISDPQEVIARAKALTDELETPIAPGFEALVFKASRGIEDIYELTYIRKDGSRFPAVVSVTALRDAQDVIIGYLLIGTDNTARKQIEADQKQLEQRLRDHQFYTRSLFEANIDALMTTDQNGIITDVNRQMETLTGCTRDELIGAPFKDYFTDPDQAEIAIKRVLSERTITNYEITAFDWVGKNTVVSLNATTFYDRKRRLQGVFVAARDITELKQIEIALRESTFLWKFAIEGSGDGVWDRNLLTNEISYSIRWMEMLGYAENDIPLTRQEWLNRIHPDDQLRVKTAVESYLSGEVKSYSTEYRLSCKDDSYKWIHERGMVVSYAEDGTPLRMIGTNTDISQRKFQEQKDKAHLNQLSHVTRLGLMGEMASGIAHEVNQPLTAISTYTQVSLNIMKAESPDLVKLVDIIYKTQQQALRAGQIIRRMREFVKSNTKQTSIADINKLIEDAVSLCLPDLRFRNIGLTFELKSPLPLINIDTIQIEQVIINLIRNSADALDSCPKNQQREISIQSLLTLNNGIEIRIKDNGQGISEDEQQKILMPFYTTKAEGMGMGLSISNSIIEAHHGTLRFNSKVGNGTTFYFNLPIQTKSNQY